MNVHNIVYKGIRVISILSILGLLSIGFIVPISFVQGMVINPVILVSLMGIFAIANAKLESVKESAAIVHLPNNSECKSNGLNKAA